jgi:hypothetical protein
MHTIVAAAAIFANETYFVDTPCIRSEEGKRRKHSQVCCCTYFGVLSSHPPQRQEGKIKVKKCKMIHHAMKTNDRVEV